MELENANGKYNFTFCEGLICWECNVDGSPSVLHPSENGLAGNHRKPYLVMFRKM